MNTKILLGVVIVIVIGVGVVFWLRQPTSDEGAKVQTPDTAGKIVFTWHLADLGYGPEDMSRPNTGISLSVGDKTYPIGTFSGSCSEIGAQNSWSLYEGEKTGVVCMWGGGGFEFGVFEENGRFVVKRGDLDEGSAEVSSVRGNFQTILTLE